MEDKYGPMARIIWAILETTVLMERVFLSIPKVKCLMEILKMTDFQEIDKKNVLIFKNITFF
jgi:hypothetical protein